MTIRTRKARRSLAEATPLEQALAMAVADLKEGEVVSYSDIAKRAGRPAAARAAGALLSKAIASLPWWRVVYSSGKLPPCNPELQQQQLEAEAVLVQNGKVISSPLGRFRRSRKR